jgi:hypothetical protein
VRVPGNEWRTMPVELEKFVHKNIIVIAAPFGFGPAAKALMVGDSLVQAANITLFSAGDAFRFISRFCASGVSCLEGSFESVFPSPSDLDRFDYFISVDNEPAVHHLIRNGFAARTIFVDDILPWRFLNCQFGFAQDVLAILVQDFPGAIDCLSACRAKRTVLSAPMVWASRLHAREAQTARENIVLHLGGVTSQPVPWESVRGPVEYIVRCGIHLARQHGRRLRVIGSRHLLTLAQKEVPDVDIVAELSPQESAAHICGCELLLTTPGIGAVYEAMAGAVPTVLLPPMNSTQLHQYGIFTERGFPGSIDRRVLAGMLSAGQSIPWGRQTMYAIQWLQANPALAMAELPAHLARLLGAQDRESGRRACLANQARFYDSLSATNAITVIGELVA